MRAIIWTYRAFLTAVSFDGLTRSLSAAFHADGDFDAYEIGQLESPKGSTPYGGSGWTASGNVLDSNHTRVLGVARSAVYHAGTVYAHGRGTRAEQRLVGLHTNEKRRPVRLNARYTATSR